MALVLEGAMALVLEGAVAQFAKPVEEDGTGERVAGLTLVEDAAGAAPLFGIVEPVEHEQGAFDPPYLSQRAGNRVLAHTDDTIDQAINIPRGERGQRVSTMYQVDAPHQKGPRQRNKRPHQFHTILMQNSQVLHQN